MFIHAATMYVPVVKKLTWFMLYDMSLHNPMYAYVRLFTPAWMSPLPMVSRSLLSILCANFRHDGA